MIAHPLPSAKSTTHVLVRRSVLVYVLALLLLMTWAVRMFHLTFYDLRGDEVFGIDFSAQPFSSFFAELAHGEPHPPGFYLLLRYWVPLAGDSPLALRWIAVAGGSLSVAMLVTLGRRMSGQATGIAAGLIGLLSPYLLWNSQDARMYALAAFLSAAASYWAFRLLTESHKRRRSAVLTTSFLILALYIHYYCIYVALLLNVFAALVIADAWRRGKRRDAQVLFGWWAATQVVALAAFLPWALFAIDTLTTYHGSALSPTMLDAIRTSISTFAFGYDLPQQLASQLLPVYVVGLVAGIITLTVRRQRLHLLFLLLWLVFPIAAIWLSSRTRPIFDPRYIIESSIPFYVLLATNAAWVVNRQRWKQMVSIVGVTALVAPMVIGVRAVYFFPIDGRGHQFTELAAFLLAHVQPGDLLIANHLDPVVHYYPQHAGVREPFIVEPSRQGLTPAQLNDELTRAIAGHTHVWL